MLFGDLSLYGLQMKKNDRCGQDKWGAGQIWAADDCNEALRSRSDLLFLSKVLFPLCVQCFCPCLDSWMSELSSCRIKEGLKFLIVG